MDDVDLPDKFRLRPDIFLGGIQNLIYKGNTTTFSIYTLSTPLDPPTG